MFIATVIVAHLLALSAVVYVSNKLWRWWMEGL